ncbi:response regulator [Paenibacillus artemisiicola]|nr:response regulator [Paenibacillus artemisiicola]
MEEGGVTMYKVLLVDDEPLAIQGLELLVDWEKHGFRVCATCEDGEEALRLMRGFAPDLVVTDIRMPALDGLGLIEETRRSGDRSTRFVITSGYDDFDYARRAMRLGVSHYLTKPVIPAEADDVLSRLRAELRGRERSRAIRDGADRHALREALSCLLAGGADDGERPEADPALARLSGEAGRWVYVHVETEPEETGRAFEAAQRLAADCGACHAIDGGPGAFGLALGLASDGEAEGEREIRAFAERLLAALRAEARGRIGIAAGSAEDRPAGLAASYGSAAEARRFLFFGGAAVVHYADIRGRTLSRDPGMLRAADAILDAVEGGDPGALAAAVGSAFRAFEALLPLPELVGIFAAQAVMRCAVLCKELGGDPDELPGVPASVARGPGGAQLADVERELAEFCLRSQAVIAGLQAKRAGGTPSKVAEYLRAHYREPLTIKELAERFYVHPVYLGQSFSRKFGTGILDFAHDLRIAEAKRLLRETDASAGAAAEAVGYRVYQQFLKQFEKRLGMKPAEYKLSPKT